VLTRCSRRQLKLVLAKPTARISEQYRAVGVRTGDTIEWIWIGTQNEFENLFA